MHEHIINVATQKYSVQSTQLKKSKRKYYSPREERCIHKKAYS